MGHRTVKRVPLDFDWPQGEIWMGYCPPDTLREQTCEACSGRGFTSARLWVEQIATLALIVDEDRNAQTRGHDLHPYLRDSGTIAYGTRPSPDYAEFGAALAGRPCDPFGHDAVNRWHATEVLIKAAGLDPETWGVCAACGGHGSFETHPGQRDEAEMWEPFEPPTGDGWQLWETVSEGSPTSPVFTTAEELATWCETCATWFGSMRWSREEWLRSFLAGTTDTDSLLVVRTPDTT